MTNIQIGKTYNGTVKSVRNFGVFVECIEGEEGLVHISEIENCRIDKIDDVCSVGDSMTVKCIGVDDKGRVRLSHRAVICEEQGLPYEVREVKPRKYFPSGDFGNRNSGGRSFGPRRFDGGRSFGGGYGDNSGGSFGRGRQSGSSGSSRSY